MKLFAFIRKLFWCFFCWETKTIWKLSFKNVETLLVVPFGFHQCNCPIGSNNRMAEIIREILLSCRVPHLVIPKEIADFLCVSPTSKITDVQKTHAGGEIFDIFKMIYRRLVFLSEEKKPGCVVAIIAHPRDARLYALAAKKLGLYVIIPDTSEIGYDPLSDRWWTSNAIAFTVYEISERLYALFAGKI